MSDIDPDRDAYVADALGEVLRSLAHDAANCAAVFDMEVGELGVGDADEVASSLRSATERLREHVQDLRVLAGARSVGDCALDEVTKLVLRLLSRSARRDLGAVGRELTATRAKVPQLHAALVLMVVVRELLTAGSVTGLVEVRIALDGESAVVTVLADLASPAIEGALARGGAVAGRIAVLSADRVEHAGRSHGRLRIAFPRS